MVVVQESEVKGLGGRRVQALSISRLPGTLGGGDSVVLRKAEAEQLWVQRGSLYLMLGSLYRMVVEKRHGDFVRETW